MKRLRKLVDEGLFLLLAAVIVIVVLAEGWVLRLLGKEDYDED